MGGETRLLESNAQLGFRFARDAGEASEEPLNEDRFLIRAEGDFYIGDQLLRVNYFCRSRQLFLPVVARLIGPFRSMTSRAVAAILRFGPPPFWVLLS